ncbi:MAG: hypothetical protein IT174_09330 [Acidobacteria bacterium]|nr:hypothetical protein [Acidobacteriota bacterium]
MERSNSNNRRNFLKSAAATLVAASVPVAAAAQKGDDEASGNQQDPIYIHGCAWNRDLPGVFGQACFTFEVRAKVGGTGVGTIRDDVYPEVNSQIQINSVTKSGKLYTFHGEIVASRSAELVGMCVTIEARSLRRGEGSATITVSSGEGENLVVIAIIAVLIGLLMPAVQK